MACQRSQQLGLLLFVCAAIAAGRPAWAQPGPPYGGTLVLATTSDPKSFNTILAKETSTSEITAYIFEGLTATDGVTAKVKPNLAERWDVSPDGLTWTFYLRPDAVWSDGVPFTADDVVFTFQDLIYNDDIPSSARDIFSIDGKTIEVRKIDDHTVRFVLPFKFAPFLRTMSQEILPKHLLAESVADKSFNFTWGIDTDPRDIIGTGPFKLVSYQPGERIVFERNPAYWKRDEQGRRLPYLDRVIYLIVQNRDVELMKFLDGELDYTALRGMDYPLVKPREKDGNFTVYDLGPAFGTNFIVFNQNTGANPQTGEPFVDSVKMAWFKDLAFRRAVAHAIDKEKIIEIVMNGLGSPQHSAMSPSAGFFYNGDVTKYEYDPARARQILADAGYQDRNTDGVIEDSKGHPLEFTLYTNSGATERMQIAAIIRQDLQDLGMKVNFLPLEFNNLVKRLTSTFDWDAIIIGLTGGVEPHHGKNVWVSDGGLHMWFPRQEKPATDWEKRIDDIFSAAVRELDENKRKALYDEHQRIVSGQLPVIYTVLSDQTVALRNKFGNLKPSGYGGVFHNLEEIHIKEKAR